MRKYARVNSSLDEKKIKESKELLEPMGIAVVQAPGEGEAQASYFASQGITYATASQDYDCLMFKAPRLIQNLSMATKRKTVSGYVEVHPQIIELKEVLKELDINQEQLICLGIICGTDYNPGGVKGLGPKKSLSIVREYKTKEKIIKEKIKEILLKYEFSGERIDNQLLKLDELKKKAGQKTLF